MTIANPANPAETYTTRLWPAHCVAGTPGNALGPALEASAAGLDAVVLKGTDARVETYSAFRAPLRDPPLRAAESGLRERLEARGVTDVFVVGLAGDYCVRCTALDARDLGWRTYVVQEGTRCVGGEEAWAGAVKEMEAQGVKIVSEEGREVGWVKAAGPVA